MRTGVDLGGTKIEAIVLGPDGAERARRRVATPRDDYGAIVRAVRDLVQAAERQAGAEAATLGVGIPGVVSPATGLVKNANTTCLIGRPLDRDLAAALGRPVRLANDANCFALSEASDGAAAGAAQVFAVILGTGVGGGLVAHGRLIEGANAIAGEWGHNPLPWPEDDERPGPLCYCGRRGCIETFLSGPALAASHGDGLGAAEVVRRAEAGDAKAEATLRRYERRLAKALATTMNLFDPDVVVLGGGLSNVARLYDNVPPLWAEYVFSDEVATKLRRAKHGDSSGVRGAAWLWPG
jgi:fructokinase